MTLRERIDSFAGLGSIMRDLVQGKRTLYTDEFEKVVTGQQFKNGWFAPGNVVMAVEALALQLTRENLESWTGRYTELESAAGGRTIGVVMAGNIPLAGFHDFLSVLISGNNLLAKTSSKDPDLILFLTSVLTDINPEFSRRITFTDGLIRDFDAIIATGSDNSARYFEYYFGRYRHIIRRNRNSIAIIEGNETKEELEQLGLDVFSYFGLGCRSVSKIFLPAGYDLKLLISSWSKYQDLIIHNKYANNYDYNKAVFIVNKDEFTDTGYLLLKEDKGLSSPVAVLYYEFYDSMKEVLRETEIAKDRIQCIVSRNHTPFGMAQQPKLWDYADGTDTLDFLSKKNDREYFIIKNTILHPSNQNRYGL